MHTHSIRAELASVNMSSPFWKFFKVSDRDVANGESKYIDLTICSVYSNSIHELHALDERSAS